MINVSLYIKALTKVNMSAATFGAFIVDNSEAIAISGSIVYPYIKVERLRSYTTLQVAARTTEQISLDLRLSPDRFDILSSLASGRSRVSFMTGTKNWGKFQITALSRSLPSHVGLLKVQVELTQVEAIASTGDFTPLSEPFGSFGLLDILKQELLSSLDLSLDYPQVQLGRLQSFPKIQNAGDNLEVIVCALRFDTLYNTVSPFKRLDTVRALADFYSFYSLVLGGVNYGDFVVDKINWELERQDKNGEAIALKCNLSLLQSPVGLPPRLPIITSLLVNGVEKVTGLAIAITSITYVDPITGGMSLLELEFDAEVAGIPVEGDTIRIMWKYQGESNATLMDTGLHKCDRPQRTYTPDVVSIGAQSFDFGLQLNSVQPITYNSSSLSGIVNNIASLFGLTAISDAATVTAGTTDTTTGTVKVTGSSYLEILNSIADDYGYRVRIKYGSLIFQSYAGLESGGARFSLTPSDCTSASFTTKVKGTYRQVFVPYKTGSATITDTSVAHNDILDLRSPNVYYQDVNSALARSAGALKEFNSQRHTGAIAIEGNYLAESGYNINLVSWRESVDNGKFQITKATHKISAQSGWMTELEARKVF